MREVDQIFSVNVNGNTYHVPERMLTDYKYVQCLFETYARIMRESHEKMKKCEYAQNADGIV